VTKQLDAGTAAASRSDSWPATNRNRIGVMRYQGKIVEWNDARGFGFVVPNGGGEKVFLHVSALLHTQQRPRVNDAVIYEVHNDAQGRAQAINGKLLVTTPSGRVVNGRARRASHRGSGLAALWRGALFVALVVIAITLWRNTDLTSALVERASPKPAASLMLSPSRPQFSCLGKTRCPQMSSCAEATFYLRHCPGTQIDGDGDGVPCEDQLCGH
jgi:cold shock CspA family protein